MPMKISKPISVASSAWSMRLLVLGSSLSQRSRATRASCLQPVSSFALPTGARRCRQPPGPGRRPAERRARAAAPRDRRARVVDRDAEPRGTRWRARASMPGRIAAAMMKARKRRAISTFSFQRASTRRRRRRRSAWRRRPGERCRPASLWPGCRSRKRQECGGRADRSACMPENRDEHVCLEMRRHGVVLARPLIRSGGVAIAGIFILTLPWAAAAGIGAGLIAVAAAFTLRAVWQWERTRIVVTTEKLYVVNGTLHRRTKAVKLGRSTRSSSTSRSSASSSATEPRRRAADGWSRRRAEAGLRARRRARDVTGGFGDIWLSRRAALLAPRAASSVAPRLTSLGACCVLVSERASRPGDEQHAARPSQSEHVFVRPAPAKLGRLWPRKNW